MKPISVVSPCSSEESNIKILTVCVRELRHRVDDFFT